MGRTSCRPPRKHLRGYNSSRGGEGVRRVIKPTCRPLSQIQTTEQWIREVGKEGWGAMRSLWCGPTDNGGRGWHLGSISLRPLQTWGDGCRETLQFFFFFSLVSFKLLLPGTATTLKRASDLSPPPTPSSPPPLVSFSSGLWTKSCFFFVFFYSSLIVPTHVWPQRNSAHR